MWTIALCCKDTIARHEPNNLVADRILFQRQTMQAQTAASRVGEELMTCRNIESWTHLGRAPRTSSPRGISSSDWHWKAQGRARNTSRQDVATTRWAPSGQSRRQSESIAGGCSSGSRVFRRPTASPRDAVALQSSRFMSCKLGEMVGIQTGTVQVLAMKERDSLLHTYILVQASFTVIYCSQLRYCWKAGRFIIFMQNAPRYRA